MLVTAVGSNCFILSLLLDTETKEKDISIKRKPAELTFQKNNISNLFSLKLIQIIIFFPKGIPISTLLFLLLTISYYIVQHLAVSFIQLLRFSITIFTITFAIPILIS
jgi:hypothetical protein